MQGGKRFNLKFTPSHMPRQIQVKTILNKSRKRDPWFLDDYPLNPYSGCTFNCLYCYIRGSKYGEHMQEKTSVKENALPLLEKQLAARARKGQYGFIVLASATEPYLHFEETEHLPRQMLELILQYRFPVHIITKSALVSRDFELLKKIDRAAILPANLRDKLQHGTLVSFSFSCTDDETAAIFEPGATPPTQRMSILRAALQYGLHSGVSLMPLLPWITDKGENLEKMLGQFAQMGVNYIFPASITLFGNGPCDSKTLVLRAVEKHYPHLVEKYQQLFEQSTFMPSWYTGPFNKKMGELCAKYGLKNRIV
jgi:DNA repair photolyase